MELLNTINLALNWWFDRDFTEPDCINAGGGDRFNCPCGTPGMWNTNWYGQVGNMFLGVTLLLRERGLQSHESVIKYIFFDDFKPLSTLAITQSAA